MAVFLACPRNGLDSTCFRGCFTASSGAHEALGCCTKGVSRGGGIAAQLGSTFPMRAGAAAAAKAAAAQAALPSGAAMALWTRH